MVKELSHLWCDIFCQLLAFLLVFIGQWEDSEAFVVVAFQDSSASSGSINPRSQQSFAAASTTEETFALSFVDDLLLEEVNGSEITSERKDRDLVGRTRDLHREDYATALGAPLALEEETTAGNALNVVQYEWMSNSVAAESLEPVMTQQEVQLIRKAAEAVWQKQHLDSQGQLPSRFTYQYKGNSEAHVSDFLGVGKLGQEAIAAVNQCLTGRLYPWIRHAFFSYATNESSPSQLFVYDALVIRYNATAATTAIAGQPMHRDLGIVSVNIMLNEDFVGGGTYFENQDGCYPIKPSGGLGHALAHYSFERHAGAGTSEGVRDILVCFVSAKDFLPRLMNARLKQTRDRCTHHQDHIRSILCRMRHQRLAIETVPEDGEAFQYLGMSLFDYSNCLEDWQPLKSTEALFEAIRCFQHAHTLTPNDARVYNNWSIALVKMENQNKLNLGPESPCDLANPSQIYQRGLDLLLIAEQAKCLVANDLDSLSLNYGLYLANQDKFGEACELLEATATKFDAYSDNNRVVRDAYRLWKFCCFRHPSSNPQDTIL